LDIEGARFGIEGVDWSKGDPFYCKESQVGQREEGDLVYRRRSHVGSRLLEGIWFAMDGSWRQLEFNGILDMDDGIG
jgi:hypothetical protein